MILLNLNCNVQVIIQKYIIKQLKNKEEHHVLKRVWYKVIFDIKDFQILLVPVETIEEHHNFCFIIADDPFNIALSKKKSNNNDKSKKGLPSVFHQPSERQCTMNKLKIVIQSFTIVKVHLSKAS